VDIRNQKANIGDIMLKLKRLYGPVFANRKDIARTNHVRLSVVRRGAFKNIDHGITINTELHQIRDAFTMIFVFVTRQAPINRRKLIIQSLPYPIDRNPGINQKPVVSGREQIAVSA
jgi:hypothetical protein